MDQAVTRCDHFDQDDGCRLRVVLEIPTLEDCAACPMYAGPTRGLGDQIHNAARKTGVKTLVDQAAKITKKPCGCQGRREALNRKYPRGA